MSISDYLSLQRNIMSTIKQYNALCTIDIAGFLDVNYATASRHLVELRRKKILNSWVEEKDQTMWSFMTKHQYEAYLKTLESDGKDVTLTEEGSTIEA